MFEPHGDDAELKSSDMPMPPVSTRSVSTNGADAHGVLPPFSGPMPSNDADELLAWDVGEEGEVEPAFEADVHETEVTLAAMSRAAAVQQAPDDGDADAFPMDAFIIPEHASRLPEGLERQPVPQQPEPTPITEIAERLEKISHRLRVEPADALLARLASGDTIDVKVAELLHGILSEAK